MLKINTKKEKKTEEKNKKKSVVPRYITFLILSIILGGIFTALTSYAATIAASNISYSNTTSGLSATNAQGAIDEIYSKDIKNWWDFGIKEAKLYKEETCMLGTENTCVSTTCYKTKTANSCPKGTILRVRVSVWSIEKFYVLEDTGNYIKVILSHDILRNIPWNKTSVGTDGPTNIMDALDASVSGWGGMVTFSYTPGVSGNDVDVYNSNAVVGYNDQRHYSSNYISSTYTYNKRITRARLMTIAEAFNQGCNTSNKSCAKFLNIWSGGNLAGMTTGYADGHNASSYADQHWGWYTAATNGSEPWVITVNGALNPYSSGIWGYAGVRPVMYVKKP